MLHLIIISKPQGLHLNSRYRAYPDQNTTTITITITARFQKLRSGTSNIQYKFKIFKSRMLITEKYMR